MPILCVGSRKILYIHVPKTGGTWVHRLLKSYGPVFGASGFAWRDGMPCNPQHYHSTLLIHAYSTNRKTHEHDFDYVFMTVREPIARLRSEFRHRMGKGRTMQVRERLRWPISFSRWALRALSDYSANPYIHDNHIRPQSDFLTFNPEVFRLEDGLNVVRSRLDAITGLRGTAPTDAENESSRICADYSLSADAESRVRDFYSMDFDKFGY